jgi:hypothetical protein
MSHKLPEPRRFKNQQLMNEFNQMMIRIKLHLYSESTVEKLTHSMPSLTELCEMEYQIMKVLREDSEPMIKH